LEKTIKFGNGSTTQMDRADPPNYPTKLVWPDDADGPGRLENLDRLGRPDDPDKLDGLYLPVMPVKFINLAWHDLA